MTSRALLLEHHARRMHTGTVDLQGTPYAEHLTRVATAVRDAAKPAALFHDALEDGHATPDELMRILTSTELDAVLALTRRRDETYAAYVGRIATEPGAAGDLAREVKIADLRDNLGRLTPALEASRPDLRERYERALRQLDRRDSRPS